MSSAAAPTKLEHVPFLDLQAEYQMLANHGMETAILTTLRKAQFIHGTAVQAFEREWAGYCGVAEAVAMDSGTAALEITLKALGSRPRR